MEIAKIFECQKVQIKFERELKKYGMINKSPYSNSYYNSMDIDWNYKPDGSLRISDHWNFITRDCSKHCETECGTLSGWYVGVYNAETKKYKLIKKILTDEDLQIENDYWKLAFKTHELNPYDNIEVGDVIVSKAFGKGIVEKVYPDLLDVKFGYELKCLRNDKKYFDLEKGEC